MAPPLVLETDFERLLDIVLREGGTTMSIVEAYLNDSGTHPSSAVVCVAGYVFEKEQAIEFDKEWRAALRSYHLPFFRMSACAHGAEPFDKLSLDECVALETKMLGIASKWMSCGMAITVRPDMFIRVMPAETDADTPYSFCARYCLAGARRCLDQKKLEGECAYFFESGHRSYGKANEIMNQLYNDAKLRKEHRYSSHTFIGKSKATPLQAADLLAWQWYTDLKRRMRGEDAPRLGAEALFAGERRCDYSLLHCDESMIQGWAAQFRRRRPGDDRKEADNPISPLVFGNSNEMTPENVQRSR